MSGKKVGVDEVRDYARDKLDHLNFAKAGERSTGASQEEIARQHSQLVAERYRR